MNTTIAQQIANEGGVEAYLHAQQHKSLLRFLTCGSVDDGDVNALEAFGQLRHGQLDTLFIFGVGGLCLERPLILPEEGSKPGHIGGIGVTVVLRAPAKTRVLR